MKGLLSFGLVKMAFNGKHRDKDENGDYFFELDMDIHQLADNTILTNTTKYIDTLFNNDFKPNARNETVDLFQTLLVQSQVSSANVSNVNGSNVKGTPKRKRSVRGREQKVTAMYQYLYAHNWVGFFTKK